MNSRFRSAPFVAALLLSLPALVLAQSAVIGSDAPAATRRSIGVSAEAWERIAATRARMDASIEVQAQTPADAQNIVRQRSQTLLELLGRLHVDDLQAGTMALHPVYGEARPSSTDRPDNGPAVVAYRAQWRAGFETAAERAGEIVDALSRAGIARVEGFAFTATEREFSDARQRALSQAALKAREEARAVLQTLGYRAGEVVRVEIEGGGPVMPLRRGAEMMAFSAHGDAPTAVSPGLIDVRASVRLEVAY